jgi:hypothetical protein
MIFRKQVLTSLIILIIFSLFYSCSSSKETEEKEKEIRYKPEKIVKNLDAAEREYISSSKIKSIEKVSFNLTAKGKPINGEKLSTQTYDPKGFLAETIAYNNDGSVQYKYNYNYNNDGKRIKTNRYDSKGGMINYYKYDYDDYGNKTKAYCYDMKGNLEEYYVYDYDGDGNLVEEKWYSSSGKEVYRIEYDYDKGIKVQTTTYDENDDLIYKYILRYDDKGNIIEEAKYNDSDNQAGLIQYIYVYY